MIRQTFLHPLLVQTVTLVSISPLTTHQAAIDECTVVDCTSRQRAVLIVFCTGESGHSSVVGDGGHRAHHNALPLTLSTANIAMAFTLNYPTEKKWEKELWNFNYVTLAWKRIKFSYFKDIAWGFLTLVKAECFETARERRGGERESRRRRTREKDHGRACSTQCQLISVTKPLLSAEISKIVVYTWETSLSSARALNVLWCYRKKTRKPTSGMPHFKPLFEVLYYLQSVW